MLWCACPFFFQNHNQMIGKPKLIHYSPANMRAFVKNRTPLRSRRPPPRLLACGGGVWCQRHFSFGQRVAYLRGAGRRSRPDRRSACLSMQPQQQVVVQVRVCARRGVQQPRVDTECAITSISIGGTSNLFDLEPPDRLDFIVLVRIYVNDQCNLFWDRPHQGPACTPVRFNTIQPEPALLSCHTRLDSTHKKSHATFDCAL